jgi:DNA-binding NarL/FixJ family response regulator
MNASSAEFTSSRQCRLIIVDDHAIMRDGLCAILESEPDVEIVGTARDGKSAIELVNAEEPDIVVIDLSMPRTDGAQAIRVIKRRHPDIRIVVLTFHKEDAHIHAALEAGADAYVLKDDGRADLLAAVRNVRAGHSYLSPAVCERVVSGYLQATERGAEVKEAASWEALSAREREVLKLVAEGYKTREIAEYLSLSKKTVEKHRANMMRKLDLHGVSAVTVYAIENGLLSH